MESNNVSSQELLHIILDQWVEAGNSLDDVEGIKDLLLKMLSLNSDEVKHD